MPRKSEIMRCNIQGVFSNTILKLQELWDEVGLSDSQVNGISSLKLINAAVVSVLLDHSTRRNCSSACKCSI